MKNKLTSAVKSAVIAVFLCCAGNVFAQQVPMVGGYKSASVNDKAVVYAAKFATQTIAQKEEISIEYDSVLKAEYQTVQGRNYRLYFQTVFTTPNDETFYMCVNAVIYRDLKNKFKLTSWKEAECPSDENADLLIGKKLGL